MGAKFRFAPTDFLCGRATITGMTTRYLACDAPADRSTSTVAVATTSHANNTTDYFQLKPGNSSGVNVGSSVPTAPNGNGWLFPLDYSSFTGTGTAAITSNYAFKFVAGTGATFDVEARVYVVNIGATNPATSISSYTQIGSFTMTSVSGTAAETGTVSLSAQALGTDEYLYIEFFVKMTVNGTTDTCALHGNSAVDSSIEIEFDGTDGYMSSKVSNMPEAIQWNNKLSVARNQWGEIYSARDLANNVYSAIRNNKHQTASNNQGVVRPIYNIAGTLTNVESSAQTYNVPASAVINNPILKQINIHNTVTAHGGDLHSVVSMWHNSTAYTLTRGVTGASSGQDIRLVNFEYANLDGSPTSSCETNLGTSEGASTNGAGVDGYAWTKGSTTGLILVPDRHRTGNYNYNFTNNAANTATNGRNILASNDTDSSQTYWLARALCVMDAAANVDGTNATKWLNNYNANTDGPPDTNNSRLVVSTGTAKADDDTDGSRTSIKYGFDYELLAYRITAASNEIKTGLTAPTSYALPFRMWVIEGYTAATAPVVATGSTAGGTFTALDSGKTSHNADTYFGTNFCSYVDTTNDIAYVYVYGEQSANTTTYYKIIDDLGSGGPLTKQLFETVTVSPSWVKAPKKSITEIIRVALATAVTDIYVATTGNDTTGTGKVGAPYATFSKANTMVKPGGRVYVRGGTYSQRLMPSVNGVAGNPITWQAYPGETVTIDGTGVSMGTDQNDGLIDISGNYTIVKNINVTDSVATGIVLNADGITIDGCNVSNCQLHGISTDTNRQPQWSGTNIVDLLVQNCEVTTCVLANTGANANGQAMSIIADRFVIRWCHVHHNNAEGIDIWLSAQNGEVYGCTVHENGQDGYGGVTPSRVGIYVDGATNIRIHDNLIYSERKAVGVFAEDAYYLNDNIHVYNNVIYDTTAEAFFVYEYNSGSTGAGSSTNIKFYNNTVFSPGGVGFYAGGYGNTAEIFNNIFAECSSGVSFTEGSGSTYNFHHNTANLTSTQAGNTFQDKATFNFRLKSGASLAIDLATTIPTFTDEYASYRANFDYAGVLRGSISDLGAYEYTSLLTKTITETITLVDTVVKKSTKAISETVAVAPVLAKRAAKALAEAITTSPALVKFPKKALAETVTVAPVAIKGLSRTFVETVTLAATLANKPKHVMTETISVAVGMTKGIIQKLSETVTVAPALAKKPLKKLVEAIVLSAAATAVTGLTKQLFETITLSDAQMVKKITKVMSETITIAAAQVSRYAKKLSETITVAPALGKALSRKFSETIYASEVAVRAIAKKLNETINVTSVAYNVQALFKTLYETITLADSILYGFVVGAALTIITNMRNAVGTSLTSVAHVLGPIGADLRLRLNMLGFVGKDITIRAAFYGLVGRAFTAKLNVSELVNNDLTVEANTLTTVGNSLTTKANILRTAHSDLNVKANVMELVYRDFTLLGVVRQLVNSSFTTRLNVINHVVSTLTSRLNIQQLAGNNLTTAMSVHQTVGADLTVSVNTLDTVYADLITQGAVIYQLAGTSLTMVATTREVVGAALTSGANVLTSAGRNLTTKAGVRERVGVPLTVQVNMMNRVSNTLTFMSHVRTLVSRLLTIPVKMGGSVGRNLTLKTNLRGLVDSSLIIVGQALEKVGVPLTTKAAVRVLVGAALTTHIRIAVLVGKNLVVALRSRQLVNKDLTIQGGFDNTVGSNLTIRINGTGQVGASLPIFGVVSNTVGKSLTIKSNVEPFDEQDYRITPVYTSFVIKPID